MKKLLKISIAAAMALVAGYSIYASQQKVELSDLTQRNIEALATNESSDCHYVNGYVAFTTKSGEPTIVVMFGYLKLLIQKKVIADN